MKRKLVKKITSEGTPLPAALKATELSSSSYYYQPKGEKKTKALDRGLVAAITIVRHGRGEVYGYRKITRTLKAQGMTVNAKKVLRHLRILGLTQPKKVKGIGWRRMDLIKPDTPDSYWEADFLQFHGVHDRNINKAIFRHRSIWAKTGCTSVFISI
ncbi:IS3 family transposase [Chloroflexota bacterium]